MDDQLKMKLDIHVRRKKAEREETNKIIEKFANTMFKRNPKLLGLTICGVQEPNPYNNKNNNILNGVFIENKDALVATGEEVKNG